MTRKNWTRLIAFSVFLRQPAMTATLLQKRMKRLDKGYKNKPADLPSLLVIRKIGFEEDILNAFGEAKEVALWGISHRAIKPVASNFFPPDTDDNNYARPGPDFERRRARCHAYWRRVWRHLDRRMKLRTVMSGNHAYWAEQELARATEEFGTPFIALHKESFKSPGFYDYCLRLTEVGRAPFNGRKIFVYCQQEKDVQVGAGVAPAERIEVTGMPRLDPVHQARRIAAGSPRPTRPPTVLAFAFSRNAGLPGRLDMTPALYARLSDEDRRLLKLEWEKLAPLFHGSLARLARENPDLRVIVKTKKGDMPNIRTWFEEGGVTGNLSLIHEGELSALLSDCDVVCGLASTALVEAIAADRPIVVPRFEEAGLPEFQAYLPDYGQAAERVETPEAMIRRLVELAREQRPPRIELPEDYQRYLQIHLGNPDGQSGRRVREAVLQEISRSGRVRD